VLTVSAHADLRGRTHLVTGANTGVGRATATALAARGADVVLACRSRERAEAVLAEIEAMPDHGAASFLELDLADLSSVRRAAASLSGRRIDVLINNAGVGGARGITRDGFEVAFGTNHLGHYLLTRLLLPQLPAGGRVVHLGSGSHARVTGLALDRVTAATRTLSGIHEYGVSKLAVMLFHHELSRRFREERRPIASLVADPGDVASDAYRHLPWPVRALWVRSMKSTAEGARTTLFCATAPGLEPRSGGSYVDARPFVPSALARDPELARALWERSAAWVGLDAGSLGP
jgi:retinol dehydrogenase 12